jgi:hypothetical protein
VLFDGYLVNIDLLNEYDKKQKTLLSEKLLLYNSSHYIYRPQRPRGGLKV